MDGFRYLASLSLSQLETWLKLFLRYGYSGPVGLVVRDDLRSNVFADEIWDLIGSESCSLAPQEREDLRKRIKSALRKLLDSWTLPSDSPEYLFELVSLIGYTRSINCYNRLIDLAYEGELRGVGEKFDIHREILRALFGMKGRKRRSKLKTILSRDINDPRYSALCFRKYWMMRPENGIHKIRDYLKTTLQQSQLTVSSALMRFHTTTGADFFKNNFLAIRGNLLRSSSYQQSEDPSLLYDRYKEGIKDLCTIRCRLPIKDKIEPKLASFMQRVFSSTALTTEDEQRGFAATWHPPYHPEARRELFISFDLQQVDVNVLEVERIWVKSRPPKQSFKTQFRELLPRNLGGQLYAEV